MTRFPIEEFKGLQTPFYFYDLALLDNTLSEINRAARDPRFKVHYAIKANANPGLLRRIQAAGLGVDCVSGGEIEAAIEAGFKNDNIVYAGVGKSDQEIELALEKNIGCFNIESAPELCIIDEIAGRMGKTANVAIRVNPNIDAHTHEYITTGLAENKFGVNLEQLSEIVDLAIALPNIRLKGLHFHIGSQITETEPFVMLCQTINSLQEEYENRGISFSSINVGGGLGID
ncbi:MAG: alanine racemase, partial [Duncaniella sp.]|nr:alanine racemase [Duncaniella sp.]